MRSDRVRAWPPVGVDDREEERAGEELGEVVVSALDTRPTPPAGGFLETADMSR